MIFMNFSNFPTYHPKYRLRVEGVMLKGGNGGRARASGGIVFEHEQPLQFSRKFLSILISTNKVRFPSTG